MSKQSYRGYREAAQAQVNGQRLLALTITGGDHGGPGDAARLEKMGGVQVRVPEHAEVHEVEGGAFVEAVIWVPEGAVVWEQGVVTAEDVIELSTFSAACVLFNQPPVRDSLAVPFAGSGQHAWAGNRARWTPPTHTVPIGDWPFAPRKGER